MNDAGNKAGEDEPSKCLDIEVPDFGHRITRLGVSLAMFWSCICSLFLYYTLTPSFCDLNEYYVLLYVWGI